MTGYTVRFKQEQRHWHWIAKNDDVIILHGWGDSLWDAMNAAYRAIREEMNSEGGTLW